MGKRGPRPRLNRLRQLDGNPGKRAIEPTGIEGLGEPVVPEHLSDEAQGCIESIKKSMPAGVYSALDVFLLAAFATAWSIHKRATCEMLKPGFKHIIESSKGGSTKNPWLRIVSDNARIMAQLGDKLGLSPAARAALKLPEARQQASKFEGLIGHQPEPRRRPN